MSPGIAVRGELASNCVARTEGVRMRLRRIACVALLALTLAPL